jgi:hypothetical protein
MQKRDNPGALLIDNARLKIIFYKDAGIAYRGSAQKKRAAEAALEPTIGSQVEGISLETVTVVDCKERAAEAALAHGAYAAIRN